MITLVEFLAPIKRGTHRNRVLAILYYAQHYENEAALTVDGIRSRLTRTRIANARTLNIADVLSKAGHFVDTTDLAEHGARLWKLTSTGEKEVREVLGLPEAQPEVEHDVHTLQALALRITDDVVRGYVDEAILCLQVGALRAAVVFLWSGAIRTLQEEALRLHTPKDVTAAFLKHDPRARAVSKVEDFAGNKDTVALLALRELGLLDKGEWQTLDDALGLRNRCGHPTRYSPGAQKVAAFVEDLVGVAFK